MIILSAPHAKYESRQNYVCVCGVCVVCVCTHSQAYVM